MAGAISLIGCSLLFWVQIRSAVSQVTRTTPAYNINVDDSVFYQANRFLAYSFDWLTEEPPFKYEKRNVIFDFAYSGGGLYKREPKIGMTYGIGIKGRDEFGRTYRRADCMGLLIHPEIVMTLCACVNSYLTSFYGLEAEEATDDRFRISNSSDPDFDIRTATLYAVRTTWEGYIKRTGDQDYISFRKEALPSYRCWESVTSDALSLQIGQYKCPVFLRLIVPITHPRNQSLPPNFPYVESYSSWEEARDALHPPKQDDKLEMIAYFQRQFPLSDSDAAKNIVPYLTIVNSGGEPMDFSKQLMIVYMRETRDPHDYSDDHLYSCSFEAISSFLDIKREHDRLMQDPDVPGRDEKISMLQFDMELYKHAFSPYYVGCFMWECCKQLCYAPPGSPIIQHNSSTGADSIVGLLITPFRGCEKLRLDKSGRRKGNVYVLVMLLNPNSLLGKLYAEEAEEAIRELNAVKAIERKKHSEQPFKNYFGKKEPRLDIVGNIDPQVIPGALAILKKHHYVKSNVGRACWKLQLWFNLAIDTIVLLRF